MVNKIQQNALATVKQALAMLVEAQDQMLLASRFGAEPEIGTILVFDKVFPDKQAELNARGLTFDPVALVPNLDSRARAGMNVVVFDDADAFAEYQKTSYRYVAIHISDDLWFTTAARGAKKNWQDLAEFIGDSPCWKVSAMEEIPVEAPEAIEATAEVAQADDVTLAAMLGANRTEAMKVLQTLRANGKNPTPKTIIDALAKIGSGSK